MNFLKYHYVCDDLQVLGDTEKSGLSVPRSKIIEKLIHPFIKKYLPLVEKYPEVIANHPYTMRHYIWLNDLPKYFCLKTVWMILRGRAYWEEINMLNHIIPATLHLINSILIYLVFGHNPVSLLAAMLFLIHPLHTEVSIWLSAKHYSITTTIVLLAWGLPLLAPFLFLLSPFWFFCANGLFSPLVFLLRPDWFSLIALMSIWTIYSKSRNMFGKDKDGKYINGKLQAYAKNTVALSLNPGKIIIGLKFYGYFLANSIFALHYSFYQSYMDDFIDTQEGIERGYRLDKYFFIGVLGIFILITNLIWNYNLAVFGLFWATVNVFMWCNVINTGQQYIANRYYYLANVGICLMLAYSLIGYPWIAGLLLGWYLRQLIPAIKQFKNVYWHFFYQIADEPDFYYSWINMGNMNFNRGHFSTAIGDYEQALILRPNNFKALFNLSGCWIARGRIDRAIICLEKSRKADVYAQEETAAKVIKDRMELINKFVAAKGNIKLKISDIPTVA
jgi:tetratricopeptide (TPR) repeat protein